jgi:hypothetical protein
MDFGAKTASRATQPIIFVDIGMFFELRRRILAPGYYCHPALWQTSQQSRSHQVVKAIC